MPGDFLNSRAKDRLVYVGGIILTCVLGAILFGIAHDMVTAHVAVEYFTKYHPRLIESESPVAMAFLWGVIATWWMGAFFGAIIGVVGAFGTKPLLPIRRVARALALGLIAVFVLSMLVLVGSFVTLVTLDIGNEVETPELIAVRITHISSYLFTAGLGVILCFWVARTRRAIDPSMPAWVEP